MKIDFNSIEYVNIPNYFYKIVKIKNLKLKHNDSSLSTKRITDKVYLFHFDNYFYHQIQEIATQYDFIKYFYPDIKIIFFDRYSVANNKIDSQSFFNNLAYFNFGNLNTSRPPQNKHKYFEDLYKIYLDDAIDKNIYSLNAFNYIFDEVYLITDVVSIIPHSLFIDKGLSPIWTTSQFTDSPTDFYKDMNPLMIKLFRDRLTKYLNKNDHYPQKIYISRKDANQRYNENLLSNIDYNKKHIDFIKTRFFKEDQQIEEYFASFGYEPLVLEGMSFIDQLQYFYNATHIAGTIGSGFLNIIAAPEKCKVFELHVLKNYYFGYKYISDVMKHNHYKIKLSLQDNIEGMINMLNYYKDEY